ncbi:MAG: sulfatase-like hydrolase/transferase, partial [Acidimicrobiales bacterium]
LDSLVELDHHVGQVVDKVRELGIAESTLIFWTTDNGAWQDVYPDCGYTPFRGEKGTDLEGGSRVPAIAWWPGTIEPGRRNSDIVGSLDFMATFASLAGLKLPTEDREGKPTIFDSCDQTALLEGTGASTRDRWYYMIETELLPGAIRAGKWKAVWNVRDDWLGPAVYTAEGPRLYDLWQDPQERYDILMTHWTEKTWMMGPIGQMAMELLASYKEHPNRPIQTVVLGAAEFYADDALVQAQVKKMLHGLAANN